MPCCSYATFSALSHAHRGDRFEQQDVAIERFRRFASEKNIHITLVVHPRKEDEGIRLGLSSIFGSAKATQEADLVTILQNDGEVKYLDVRKNRYDGELGIVPLSFSQHTSAFYEDPDLMATIKQRMANAASKKGSFGR
jgi:twinkle protein